MTRHTEEYGSFGMLKNLLGDGKNAVIYSSTNATCNFFFMCRGPWGRRRL